MARWRKKWIGGHGEVYMGWSCRHQPRHLMPARWCCPDPTATRGTAITASTVANRPAQLFPIFILLQTLISSPKFAQVCIQTSQTPWKKLVDGPKNYNFPFYTWLIRAKFDLDYELKSSAISSNVLHPKLESQITSNFTFKHSLNIERKLQGITSIVLFHFLFLNLGEILNILLTIVL